MVMANAARRTDRIGVQYRREVPHALRSVDKHTAQLAAAHDA
jgi:hypothetical protein